jgi:hypothetical protein
VVLAGARPGPRATADLSIPGSVVATGEVGLAGEVRRVPGVARRLAEAERMGFRRAIVPAGSGGLPSSGDLAGQSGPGDPPGPGDRPRSGALHVVGPEDVPGTGGTGKGRRVSHGGLTDVREVEDIREAIAAAMGG